MIKPVLQDDAFLADVSATRDERSDSLRLWWLGQSGFLLQCHGRHVLLDPYLSDSLTTKYAGTDNPHVRMTERVVAPEKLDFVDLITSTHGHTDHLDAESLVPIARATMERWIQKGHSRQTASPPHLVLATGTVELADKRLGIPWPAKQPMNAWDRTEFDKIEIIAVPASHGPSMVNDVGDSLYLGFVLRYRGRTVYHSGDTIVFEGMADGLRPFNIDIALLPINGKVGNMNGTDAARLAKQIGAKVVIPCHYEMFEFNTESPDEFVRECERLNQPYRVLRAGERFTYP